MKRSRSSAKKPAKPAKPSSRRISRRRKPEGMTLEQWQVALRRQFGAEQDFKLKNIGAERIFSEFHVSNPASGRTYRVAIRGEGLGENFCSCPDFAVNTLGTCKHVEFTLAHLRRRRGGRTALARGFQPPYSEVYLRYGARRQIVFRTGTQCPAAFAKLAARCFDADGLLQTQAFGRFHLFLEKALADEHEVRCYDDALEFISQVRDAEELRRRIDRAYPRGAEDPALDRLLSTKLYPFQKAGTLFAARAGRCLIADDMGLGKTIQAIAAAEILAKTMGIGRVLIVSPTSLKHQWQQEIERFTRRRALVVAGRADERAKAYQTEAFYTIVNYDVIRRDFEAIRKAAPDLIILDEAQRIKNWKTKTADVVKRLESPYAFVLTGTPLENRIEELHSIVEFVDRFRLGPLFRFLDAHQHTDETGRVIGYRNLTNVAETLKPVLIRRTKKAVLKDLPERIEKRFFLPMTPQQREHHEEHRDRVARIVAKWRRSGYLSEIDQRRLQIHLQYMRMSCNSTYLIDKESDHGTKVDELVRLLSDILEEPGVKVVVFSQWLRMHELIVKRVAARGWGHVLFHGGVPGPRRKDLVKRFREDPDCRLFLSTDAGGLGLNLQMASVVVNVDQPWNPAVIEQRIGRVHRLGQHRPVRILHLIAEGTIEEGMLGLLSFKKAMFAGVLDGGKDEVFLGGRRLKRLMDSVERATGAIGEEAPPSAVRPAATPEAPRPAAQPVAAASPNDALAGLVSAGARWLSQIAEELRGRSPDAAAPAGTSPLAGFLHTDEDTGRTCLRLPLPEPDVLDGLARWIQQVAPPGPAPPAD